MNGFIPQPVSPDYLAGKLPRPACEHDPVGILSYCPICGPNRTGQVVDKVKEIGK